MIPRCKSQKTGQRNCKNHFLLRKTSRPQLLSQALPWYGSFKIRICKGYWIDLTRRVFQNNNYAFWTLYIPMALVLLDFIWAQWEGDWDFHLKSFAALLPWLVTYDHTNYSRWGPVYLKSLQVTVSDVYKELQVVSFVIKRSCNFFNEVPPDQPTEWINKLCKSTGGIIGITQRDQARDRLCVRWAMRSQITHDAKVLYGLADNEEDLT